MARQLKSMDGNTAARMGVLRVHRGGGYLPHHPVEPHGRPC